jgi:hypothetical protein
MSQLREPPPAFFLAARFFGFRSAPCFSSYLIVPTRLVLTLTRFLAKAIVGTGG